MSKKSRDVSIVRSSTAEYLTYIAATGGSDESIELRYEDENIWLTQKMMATLYGVDVRTINDHIRKIYEDSELSQEATIRKFRIVQIEGNRQVSREVIHYNLQMIIAVGFKVNNERAVQFRKWANTIVKDFTIKGWVMDDERLKNGGSQLTKEYFDKLIEKVREIRLSERRFYQKITDIYATAVDYDPSAEATHRFFAAVQNKLHYSVHGQTAAEVIYNRADAEKEHMGLTNWDGSPNGKIHSYDVVIAKNYLTEKQIRQLERAVTGYFDYIEDLIERENTFTMTEFATSINEFLEFRKYDVLKGKGKISKKDADKKATAEYDEFNKTQKITSDFDREVKRLLQRSGDNR